MNKLLAGLSFIFLATSLFKCSYSYEDVTPTKQEMGEWDGNYIYKGNIRCKTTGEDESLLIEEIVYNDTVYFVDCVNDYIYKDNHIYMLLENRELEDDNYTIKNKNSFFIDYSIENKSYKIIYSLFDRDASLLKLYGFNDFVFIRIDKPYASLIKYDYSSEKIDFMNEELYDLYGYEFIGDNILLVYEDNMMKYTYCDSINLIDIKSIELSDTHNLQFSLVENNYLYIKSYKGEHKPSVNSFVYYDGLEIYDFNKNKLSTVFDLNEHLEITYINDEYFVKGITTTYEYVSSLRNLQTHKYEELSANLFTKNTLCKIDYKKAIYEEVYVFDEKDFDFSHGYIEDNKYYINAEYYLKGSQLSPGGHREKQYILDLNTFEFKKKKFENKKQNYGEENTKSIIFKGYEYYLTSKTYGPLIGSRFAFYLIRKNIDTNEEKIMQFFTDEVEYDSKTDQVYIKGTRFSSLLWEDRNFTFSDELFYITDK